MDNVPFIQKISPQLASLLAAAAGWALSGDVGKVGQMTPAQQMEGERAVLGKDADNGEEEEIFKSLDEWWKKNYFLAKDTIPIPPGMGSIFDPVKHRWVRPENMGRSVSEVQGKKRFRGTGAGAHERSVAGHGSGKARLLEAGRRFRAPADKGRVRFHDHQKGAQAATRAKSEIAEGKSRKKHDILSRPMKKV